MLKRIENLAPGDVLKLNSQYHVLLEVQSRPNDFGTLVYYLKFLRDDNSIQVETGRRYDVVNVISTSSG